MRDQEAERRDFYRLSGVCGLHVSSKCIDVEKTFLRFYVFIKARF